MRVLLDECMPLPLLERLADLPHSFEHATRIGLGGRPNGAVHAFALTKYDLFITNDRHFRSPRRYPLSAELGVVFVRIAPCLTESVAAPLRRLLLQGAPNTLIGRRTVLRRDGWEFKE